MPNPKPFWKSKTVLLNAAVAALAVYIEYENPVHIAQALGVINILLRFLTTTGVTVALR